MSGEVRARVGAFLSALLMVGLALSMFTAAYSGDVALTVARGMLLLCLTIFACSERMTR